MHRRRRGVPPRGGAEAGVCVVGVRAAGGLGWWDERIGSGGGQESAALSRGLKWLHFIHE